ncbi:MAG: helix-turn-helix domain-containing protein [Oscillospiraceae bacterium]|nr:helix-turn-helix domain-containing protein [Oscillospiraceae bacterium]
MEQIYFGERIAAYRKAQGLTQEGLAQQLGVTNQAVSKWEGDQCCPDIMLLPALADVFGISLDELFGREAPGRGAAAEAAPMEGLPWPDDEDLRTACFVGHRLTDYASAPGEGAGRGLLSRVFGGAAGRWQPVELHFSGRVRDIHANGDVVAERCVISGGVHANDGVRCGDVYGDVAAGDGVNCGNVFGNIQAGDSVNCGNVEGNVMAGDSVNCGVIHGAAHAGDGVSPEED